jgi:hypothetical protein
VVTIHPLPGESDLHYPSRSSHFVSNEIVVSYTEAVDRYPLLKLHISTEP